MKSNTSVGVDKIPPKLVIMSAEVIAEPLTDLINNTMLDHLIFPSVEKEASVTPAFKKEDRQFKENYRPISVLNVFSKIFERFLLNQMLRKPQSHLHSKKKTDNLRKITGQLVC